MHAACTACKIIWWHCRCVPCLWQSEQWNDWTPKVPAPINCIAVGISVVLGFSLAMFCSSKLYTERNDFSFFLIPLHRWFQEGDCSGEWYDYSREKLSHWIPACILQAREGPFIGKHQAQGMVYACIYFAFFLTKRSLSRGSMGVSNTLQTTNSTWTKVVCCQLFVKRVTEWKK